MLRKLAAAATMATGLVAFAAHAVDIEAGIPEYKKAAGISGSLKSIGSDTLNNVMALWVEGFKKEYPNVTIETEGKGSGTAPPALVASTAQFGPMSRPMKASEIDAFEKQFGYKPTAIRVGVDALALFVHKDNPVKCLSLAQLDAVFSKTRKLGAKEDAATWDKLGVTGDFASKPISLYGRNSASGTYGYFKEVVMENGDFKDGVKEQPGSSAVIQGVASDKYAIGYSGIGYKTADVHVVSVSAKAGGTCYDPSDAAHTYSGDYPISRFLYVYLNKKPGAKVDPLRMEFVKFMLSKQGQQAVVKDGMYPIPAAIAAEDLAIFGATN